MDNDIKKIECRIESLEKSIEEIKEALNKAFEREKINWKGFISDLRKPLMKLSFNS